MRLSTPVPKACTHFSRGGVLQHFGGEHGREGQERVGLGDMRPDLGVMIGNVDRKLRKARLEPVAILIADVLGQSEENEQVGHELR